jgi:mycothione reductase
VTSTFDLIIVGTGSGNSILGPEFDDLSVAIVERDVFGGTCLNKGCIPTKMFVYAADVVEQIRHADRYDIAADLRGTRWRDARDRVFGRIDPIAIGGEDYRTNRCPNVTVFRGSARFVGPKRIVVAGADGERTIEGDRVVIAAGARPVIPDIPGLADVGFYTSDDIMRVDEVPQRLAILGGGFIACEMAHVFDAFGSRITMINRGAELLKHEDHDIRSRFLDAVRHRFDVRLQVEVVRASRTADTIVLELSDGSRVETDAVLVAAGRVPNSDQLGLAEAGYALEADGRVRVDEFQRTGTPGVFALGDISSPFQLKHVANHEARVVAHNLARPDTPIASDHRFVPHAVFSSPQVASVGLTEDEARATGIDVITKVQYYGDTAYGWAMEDRTSICKVIADRATRRLVGAHLMGPYAAMLIQQLIQGMSTGQTVDDMARGQYWIHPSLSEVVENALLGLPVS